MGRRVGLAVLAAAIAFAVVQDRETSAGVGRYVAAQRAAIAGRGPRVTVDEVMRPANRASVGRGVAWGAGAGAIALGLSWLVSGMVETRWRRG